MVISERSPGRDLALRVMAWPVAMATYLTLWSAGFGWMSYWWAWPFVITSICCGWLTRRPLRTVQPPADGFVLPRVRFPASHRRRRRSPR